MAQSSTESLTAELRARIEAKIQANKDENQRLLETLKQLRGIPSNLPPASEKPSAVKVGSVQEAIDNAAMFKMRLSQLAREHGVVMIAKLPVLFKTKGWDTHGLSDNELAAAALTVIRNDDEIFEIPHKGYFRLTQAKGNGSTSKARGLSKKPLIEYAFDCLKNSPKRQGNLHEMAEYAKAQGYITHAKRTPLSQLVGQMVSDDGRFVRVQRGIYRLRANS